MSDPINVALVGFGYWGPKLARNLEAHPSFKLVAIVDADEAALRKAEETYPHVGLRPDLKTAGICGFDAVVIATPPETHASLAVEAMKTGKHVLVEKPMTVSAELADMMLRQQKNDVKLMVDHVYCYSEPAKVIKDLLEQGVIGELLYVDSTRINLGLFQQKCNVVWDLAVHDFSLLGYFFPDMQPAHVEARGTKHFTDQYDTAHIHIDYFDTAVQAHINVSWLSPTKVRRMQIVGDAASIIWDDMDPVEPVKIYNCGACVKPTASGAEKAVQMNYRRGPIHSPRVNLRETLANVLDEFAAAVRGNQPRTDGEDGRRVVEQLCLADEYLRKAD